MALSTFNSANNSVGTDKTKTLKVPMSKHNRSRIVNGNMDLGEIKILDCLHTIPNQRTRLNYLVNLRTRVPTVRQLKNGMKLYVSAIYSRWSDLWEGQKPFTTKGRFNNNNLQIPGTHPWSLLFSGTGSQATSFTMFYEDTPTSLWDDLSLPCTSYFNTTNSGTLDIARNYHRLNSGVVDTLDFNTQRRGSNCMIPSLKDGTPNYFLGNKVNALDFFLYQKYYAYYHCRADLLKNDAFGQVDNEHYWKLPSNWDSSRDFHFFTWDISTQSMKFDGDRWNETSHSFDSANYSFNIPSAQGLQYFDFIERFEGTSPYVGTRTIAIDKVIPSSASSSDSNHVYSILTKRYAKFRGDLFTSASPFANLIRGNMPTLKDFTNDLDDSLFTDSYNSTQDYLFGIHTSDKKLNNSSGSNGKAYYEYIKSAMQNTVTMNSLRQLSMITHFMELNGHTDGSYNEMINAQYDYDPNTHDGKPYYIGGDSQYVGFNSVQQVGSTTSPDDYLGKRVSEGSLNGQFNFGNFIAPDFGTILVVAYIVPDHTYSNQVNPEFTRLNQNELFFPVLSGSAPRGIRRSELYASYNDSKDNEIIGFSDAWSFMRERTNVVNGLQNLDNLEIFDSVQIMKRRFYGANGYDLNMANITCNPWTIDYSPFQDSNGILFECDQGQIVDVVNSVPYGQINSYI